MACTLTAPCGGLLKRVLVLPDATIYQCTGSSHTHRVGAPPPTWIPNMPGRRPTLPDDAVYREDEEVARKEAERRRAARRRLADKVAKREAKKVALRKHLHR